MDMLSLSVPVPCIRGKFGDDIEAFQTFVKPDQVVQLLGHDPRSRYWRKLPDDLRGMYEFLQRKTTKSRRDSTANYIVDRIGPEHLVVGAFPAISIGMVGHAEFESYHNKNSDIHSAAGILLMDLSPSNKRILLDGMARVAGAMDLIDEGKEEYSNMFTFPVTIYAPSKSVNRMTLHDFGQLFHDFNFLATPVNANQAIALDRSNIYIALTNRLAARSFLSSRGGMETRSASLGSKSTAIVVQRVLLRTVRGACEGRSFQHSNRNTVETPNLSRSTFEEILGDLDDFFEQIAVRMGVRFLDRDSLHISAPGWQALGLIFHDLKFRLGGSLSRMERERIYDLVSEVDWSRYNPDWIGLIGEPEIDRVTQVEIVDDQGRRRVSITRGGQTTVAKMTDYLRVRTGIDILLGEEILDEEMVIS